MEQEKTSIKICQDLEVTETVMRKNLKILAIGSFFLLHYFSIDSALVQP